MKLKSELIEGPLSMFKMKTMEERDGSDTRKPAFANKAKRLLAFAIGAMFFGQVVLYVMLSPSVGESTYDAFLFHPDRHDYEHEFSPPLPVLFSKLHATRKDVSIQLADGNTLDAWYLQVPGSKKVILVSHGNGGNLEYRMELMAMLLHARTSVLIYDYEGYGKSTGQPTWARIGRDGLAAYDYLTNRLHYSNKDIIVLGESLGTAVAGYIARERSVSGVVLIAGLTSLANAGQDILPFLKLYPDWSFPEPHYDNVAMVEKTHQPLLVIHGDKDTLLPMRYSQEIFAKASEPKQLVLLHGANHNDVYADQYKPVFAKALKDFIAALPEQ